MKMLTNLVYDATYLPWCREGTKMKLNHKQLPFEFNKLGLFNLSVNDRAGAKRQAVVLFALFFLAGTTFALFTGGDFLIDFSKNIGSGYFYLTDGTTELQGLGIESLGNINMSGGDYDINVNGDNSTPSKLENDLENAHCYPNPYKPNSGMGHMNITFSHVTSHIQVKIFSVAGELVYSTEADTPTGELAWDVVNNYGQKLASGVFVYLITDNKGHKKIGKFAVIR